MSKNVIGQFSLFGDEEPEVKAETSKKSAPKSSTKTTTTTKAEMLTKPVRLVSAFADMLVFTGDGEVSLDDFTKRAEELYPELKSFVFIPSKNGDETVVFAAQTKGGYTLLAKKETVPSDAEWHFGDKVVCVTDDMDADKVTLEDALKHLKESEDMVVTSAYLRDKVLTAYPDAKAKESADKTFTSGGVEYALPAGVTVMESGGIKYLMTSTARAGASNVARPLSPAEKEDAKELTFRDGEILIAYPWPGIGTLTEEDFKGKPATIGNLKDLLKKKFSAFNSGTLTLTFYEGVEFPEGSGKIANYVDVHKTDRSKGSLAKVYTIEEAVRYRVAHPYSTLYVKVTNDEDEEPIIDCTTPVGRFITSNVDVGRPSLIYDPPHRHPLNIPSELFEGIIEEMKENMDKELLVRVYRNTVTGETRVEYPAQETTTVSIHAGDVKPRKDEFLILEGHSHGRLRAFFSNVDDADEQYPGLYFVAGCFGNGRRPMVKLRAGFNGGFQMLAYDKLPYIFTGEIRNANISE